MAEDVAQLGIKITVDAGDSETRIKAIQAAAQRAGVSFEEMQRRVAQNTSTLQQNAAATKTATQAVGAWSTATARAAREVATATGNTAGLTAAMSAAHAQAGFLASRLGAVGQVLVAFGPAGIAAGVALGAVAIAIKKVADAVLALGERAGQLRDASETIGFTVEQLQALQIAAGRTGVSAQQLDTSLERFSATLAEVRTQAGPAFDALSAINPALARQVATAESVQEAWNIVAEAMRTATREEANFLARTVFGRGGVALTRVTAATDLAGGVDAFTASLRQADLITQEQAAHWDDLKDAISENMRIANELITRTFAGEALEALVTFTEAYRNFAEMVQETDFRKAASGFDTIIEKLARMNPLLAAAVGLWAALFEQASKLPSNVFGSLTSGGSPAGLPTQAEIEAAATGSPAGLPDAAALDAKYKALSETTRKLRKDTLDYVDVLRNNVSALGDAATDTEKYQLKVAELTKKFQEGTISADTYNRAIRAIEPTTVALRGVVEDLGTALARAFIEGADAADALNRSLKAVASQAASSAINNLIKGDIGGAAISGAIAVGSWLASKLFGGGDTQAEQEAQAKAAEAAKKALQEATASLEGFTSKVIALNGAVEQTPLERLQDAQHNFQLALEAAQRVAEVAHQVGGVSVDAAEANAAVAAANVQIAEAGRSLSLFYASESKRLQEFLTGATLSESEKKLQEVQQAGEALNFVLQQLGYTAEEAAAIVSQQTAVAMQRLADEAKAAKRSLDDLATGAQDLQDRINDASASLYGTADLLFYRLVQFDREAARERAEEVKAGGENLVLLEQTLMVERLALIEEFNRRILRASEALSDRMLAAQSDTSTLAGRLAVLDRQQQREREEEARQGGYNMVQLEQVQAAERLRVIDDFNKAALEAEQKAAEDRVKTINAAAKSIVDYVSGLFTKSGAGASPINRLTASAEVYQKTLALAQAGNIDAVNRLADDAETYRTALRDVYGSSQRYQEGVKQIATDLLGLPTVQSSTDQIVNAIRDSIIVLQHIDAQLSGGATTAIPGGVPPGFEQLYSQLTQAQIEGLTGVGFNLNPTPVTPTYQSGGWVGGSMRDHPIMAGADEFVINRQVAAANANWLPTFNRTGMVARNDNAAADEMRSLRRENAFMLGQIARLLRQGNEENVVAIKRQERAITSQTRLQGEREHSRTRKQTVNSG